MPVKHLKERGMLKPKLLIRNVISIQQSFRSSLYSILSFLESGEAVFLPMDVGDQSNYQHARRLSLRLGCHYDLRMVVHNTTCNTLAFVPKLL